MYAAVFAFAIFGVYCFLIEGTDRIDLIRHREWQFNTLNAATIYVSSHIRVRNIAHCHLLPDRRTWTYFDTPGRFMRPPSRELRSLAPPARRAHPSTPAVAADIELAAAGDARLLGKCT